MIGRQAWLLMALMAAGLVQATGDAGGTDQAAERSRIAAEQTAVEQRFAAAQAACQSRFLVTDCVEQARVDRRQALAVLRRQLNRLDDAQRRQRAADRLQAIRQRDAELARRRQAPAPAAPASASARAPAASAVAKGVPAAGSSAPTAAEAAARDRQRLAERQRRLDAALAHQRALEARNARQDARRPPAAGLPVPGASAVPR